VSGISGRYEPSCAHGDSAEKGRVSRGLDERFTRDAPDRELGASRVLGLLAATSGSGTIDNDRLL
jgi:hypothetical protein